MGGIAFRAPVLAALFLIVALATLAMPGSANFVGEFLILLGVFKAKLAIAIIAFAGVVMATVYALRLFIRAMHNRVGAERRVARDRAARRARARAAGRRDRVPRALPAARAAAQRRLGDASVAGGAIAHRPHGRGRRRPRPRRRTGARSHGSRRRSPTAHLKGPHVDCAALSPLIALLGGACVVLLVGLLRLARACARSSCRRSALVALGAALGPDDLAVGRRTKSIVAGRAARSTTSSLALTT